MQQCQRSCQSGGAAARAVLAGAALVLAACGGSGGGGTAKAGTEPAVVAPPGVYRGAAAGSGLRYHMAVLPGGRFIGYTCDTVGNEKAYSLVAGQGRSQGGAWTMTLDRAFGVPGSPVRPHEALRSPGEGRRRHDRLLVTYHESGRAQTLDLAVPQEAGPAPGLAAGQYSGDASLLFHEVPEGHLVPAELELTVAADGHLAGRLVQRLSGVLEVPGGQAQITGSWQAHPEIPVYEFTLAFTSPDGQLARLLGGRSFKGVAMPDPLTGALRFAVLAHPGGKPDLAVAGKVTRHP